MHVYIFIHEDWGSTHTQFLVWKLITQIFYTKKEYMSNIFNHEEWVSTRTQDFSWNLES